MESFKRMLPAPALLLFVLLWVFSGNAPEMKVEATRPSGIPCIGEQKTLCDSQSKDFASGMAPEMGAMGPSGSPGIGEIKAKCDTDSRLFSGVCILSSHCFDVCVEEGYTSGACSTLSRKCVCSFPC